MPHEQPPSTDSSTEAERRDSERAAAYEVVGLLPVYVPKAAAVYDRARFVQLLNDLFMPIRVAMGNKSTAQRKLNRAWDHIIEDFDMSRQEHLRKQPEDRQNGDLPIEKDPSRLAIAPVTATPHGSTSGGSRVRFGPGKPTR